MKKSFLINIFLIVGIFSVYGNLPIYDNENNKDLLASGFLAPPDTIQTSCYWYWISNNISEEGVVKDLYSMKKAGINRAFIGNIGLDDVPYGKVKMLTEEWWKILHIALKTATELGIDIGIFNSPGWSQSGGPWVNDTSAMRYLISSEVIVNGPAKIKRKLEQPIELFHDIKLIAYPLPKNDLLVLDSLNSTISSVPEIDYLNRIVDQNPLSGINFPVNNNVFEIDFHSEKEFTTRYIFLRTTNVPTNLNVELQAKKGDKFEIIKNFQVDRFNESLAVGFVPFAPVVETFEPCTSRDFRIICRNFDSNQGLSEVVLGSGARVERYPEKTFAKMHQTFLPYWDAYQWKKQYPIDEKELVINQEKVIDISNLLQSDGTLVWDVPTGNWVIERIGTTPTGTKNSPAAPEATGYEVDKMSKKHVATHFYGHIGEVLKRIPEEDRKSFKVVVQDSYEMGGQNYTDDFFERFEEEYGYSAIPFLPVFEGRTVGSQDESDRFLWDMRRLVANMVASEYVGGMKEISNRFGLSTWLENYGHWGFPSESLIYGSYSDEISGEYWAEGDLGNIENRMATSCGHIYGKNKISAESYTCGGNPYGRTPAMIKQRGDRFFAEGINNSLLHVYISQPDNRVPGINAWFGTEFNRNNTWFSQMDLFTSYLKRTNFMLQQGVNIADILYFIGEDAPKMTGTTDPALPKGFQFDYINYDVIMNKLQVKNGLLTLSGSQYRLLILPKLKTMRPELLAKIKQLVNDGAVIYGIPPVSSPSLKDFPKADRMVAEMAKEMWADLDGVKVKFRKYGKGLIISGMGLEDALKLIECSPDCLIKEDVKVDFSHRKVSDDDIYYLTNQSNNQEISFNAAFRISGKQPELWLPVSGEMRSLPIYKHSGSSTEVPISLKQNESVFVVFRHITDKTHNSRSISNFPDFNQLKEIKGPWRVYFIDTLRGSNTAVEFDSLYDWTLSNNDKIKYYSGTAIYKSTFTLDKLPSKSNIILNLTDVANMAKVKINDCYAGGVWTPPYTINIGEFLREGINTIEIEVVNTWVNRLLGDMLLPPDERSTWTVHLPSKETTLQKSGLLGPVLIGYTNY